MTNRFLIPVSDLASKEATVRERMATLGGPNFRIDPNDSSCGESLVYYSLFTNWPELLGNSVCGLTTSVIFYNRYYWFLHLIRLWQELHGHDAGMEQQAFQLLESAAAEGMELDWDVLQEIERQVGDSVKRCLGYNT